MDDDVLIGLLVLQVIGAFIVGGFGSTRRIGFWQSFFVALLFTPVVGIICTFVTPSEKDMEIMDEQTRLLRKIEERLK